MAYTLSFHQKANAAHRDHNIRNMNAVGGMEHIDHSYSRDNEILVDMKIREAYQNAYGASTERFRKEQIAKGIRKDRLVGDYYDQVRNDGRRNLSYEVILQIGDRNTVGWRVSLTDEEKTYQKTKELASYFRDDVYPSSNYGAETPDYYSEELEKSIHKVETACRAKEIMKEYQEVWQELNPNMYLYGAYIHADEKDGTVHMHLDFLPMAKGYQRGQDIQNGLDRACKQNVEARLTENEIQNRIAEHRSKTGKSISYVGLWQDLQRQTVKEIARDKGIELEWDRDTTKKLRHLDTREFKEKQKSLEKMDREIQKQEASIEKNKLLISEINEELILRKKASIKSEKIKNSLQKETKKLEDKKADLLAQNTSLRKSCDELKVRMDTIVSVNEELQEQQVRLQESNRELEVEAESMEEEIDDLEERRQELEADLEEFDRAKEKAQYFINQEQKTLFGKMVKVDKEEYEDLVSTMSDSIKLAQQYYDESEISYRKMEHAEDVAREAIRQRNKAIEERDEAIYEKDRFVEAAVAPLKKKIQSLEKQLQEAKKTISSLIDKVKSFEWMKYIRQDSWKQFEMIRERAKERLHIHQKIQELDEKIDFNSHKEFGKHSYEFYDPYRDGCDLDVDELKHEKYKLMIENNITVPKELQDYIDHENEMKERHYDLDLDWER